MWEVRMFSGGRTFVEIVYGGSAADAVESARARNPNATVLGVNFK